MDKLTMAAQARDYMANTPFGTLAFRRKEIVVLPTVFNPDTNTTMLAELVDELVEKSLEQRSSCSVFEMGSGAGAAIVSVARNPKVNAFASDIAPMAVLNTKVNALWWGVECVVYEGFLYENVPKESKFDIIFWNIPFFKENPGGIEDVKFRAGFDPEYESLKTFLKETKESKLADGGKVLLAVDEDMCDRPTIHQLIEEAGFLFSVNREMQMDWGGMTVRFAFLLLEKK